jgi:glutaredoxin
LAKAHVIVYSRPGCHLCDKAKAVILKSDCTDLFTLEEIDIETDPVLLQRYRNDIPVVMINGVEAFRHGIEPGEFKRKLTSHS